MKIKCFKCSQLTGHRNTDLQTCARCREVLKIDLVRVVLEMDPIYLSERNRNNKGRRPKISGATVLNDIRIAYQNGQSMGKLAKKYKVSKGTIFNIVH